ncbi:hypothetical protein SH661x_002754 [Planctomicrobium sp. SH661]|uniref:hypothetical protein n=1 Tax=Planctomicrobium sp. SH661 TaxID=3448124 RepID=UPI003F5C6A03
MPRPLIGLLPTGHYYYWKQYPELRERGLSMYAKLRQQLSEIGNVVAPELVDTAEKARAAGDYLQRERPDILLVFPFGYTPGMCVLPAVEGLDVPIRLVNAHEDAAYDYQSADTAEYLHHEGPCCVPEYAAGLVAMNRKFRVRSGPFNSRRLWDELRADCQGAAAARAFRQQRVGLIGQTYTHMVDMPLDEHRLLRATGHMLVRPEVEEIEEATRRVSAGQLEEMYSRLRELYEVDSTVTNGHLRQSAQLAVAYEEVICRHGISAFGYYWWGEKPSITSLRAESALAVSRLSSMGHPGVTEGDVRTAMAMKILDLLGAGGMFLEFFSMDYEENFVMMGHDGPSNINVADGPPRLQHLNIHHGKSGEGLGIDFQVRQGPVTLVNLTQFDAGETFKLVYTEGEVIPGEILRIGNPNCRVRLNQPLHQFFDAWCQQGPSHHVALGIGHLGPQLESLAEAMRFRVTRI